MRHNIVFIVLFMVFWFFVLTIVVGVAIFFGILWIGDLFKDDYLLGVKGLLSFIIGIPTFWIMLLLIYWSICLYEYLFGKKFYVKDDPIEVRFEFNEFTIDELKKTDVDENSKHPDKFFYADNRYLKIKYTKKKIGFCVAFFLLVISTWVVLEDAEDYTTTIISSINGAFSGVSLAALIVIIYLIFKRQWIMILDRETRLITIPGWLIFPKRTFMFDKVVIYKSPYGYRISFRHPFGIQFEVPDKGFTFYMQFMDKNLPLPGGDFFAPYREADYQRRKAEGFPPPIIGSTMTWLDDAAFGYYHATDEVKERLAYFDEFGLGCQTPRIAITTIMLFIDRAGIGDTHNRNDLAFLGIFDQEYYVFKLHAPKHQLLQMFDEETLPSDCFLCSHKPLGKVYYYTGEKESLPKKKVSRKKRT